MGQIDVDKDFLIRAILLCRNSPRASFIEPGSSTVAISHKAKVVVQYLVPAATIYLAVGAYIIMGTSATVDLKGQLGSLAIATLVGTLAQDLIPKPLKETWVFLKVRHRLPGFRAFADACKRPDQIDTSKIADYHALVDAQPDLQQRSFYKLYKKHASLSNVEHYSFRYLAWRDTSSMMLLLAVVTIPTWMLSAFVNVPFRSALWLAALALGASVIMAAAARQMARELVIQVLSSETLGEKT
jgi:hypothetical protein